MTEERKVTATLSAHAGAFKVPESEVLAIPTPRPTATHFPIPHRDFLEQVYQNANDHQLRVTKREFAVTKDGLRLFGVLTCQAIGDDFGLAIGLRNSHDKTMSAGLAAGIRVFVCDNLAMSADVVMRRKHTRFIFNDLPQLMSQMMAKVLLLGDRQGQVIANMKQDYLQDRDASHVMIEAVRKGAMPPSKIGKVIEQWHEPEHEEFAPRTSWSLLNAFTQVQKQRSPEAQLSTDLMALFIALNPALRAAR